MTASMKEDKSILPYIRDKGEYLQRLVEEGKLSKASMRLMLWGVCYGRRQVPVGLRKAKGELKFIRRAPILLPVGGEPAAGKT